MMSLSSATMLAFGFPTIPPRAGRSPQNGELVDRKFTMRRTTDSGPVIVLVKAKEVTLCPADVTHPPPAYATHQTVHSDFLTR